MIIETRVFTYLSAFFFLMAICYSAATAIWGNGGVEWAGATALVLVGGLALIVSGFFWFIARRLEQPRPEDDPDAEIADNAAELGFFSPGSIWPFLLTCSILVVGISLAFSYFWLLAVGVVLVIGAASGLVFEYHRAPEKH